MSSFLLKILAVIAMTVDHIGYAFFPKIYLLRVIGRIAMPIFAFQVALGFKHTSNRNKYLVRMLLFAVISQIPFHLMSSIHNGGNTLNIGFTFLLAILILYSLEEVKPICGKILCLIPICAIAYFLRYDYYLFGISLVLIFYYTGKKPYYMIPSFIMAATIHMQYKGSVSPLFSLIAILPILLYNEKKGKSFKYFFYAFYPIHMLVIYLVFTFCV